MASLEIILPSTAAPSQIFEVQLDGVTYQCLLRWNERESAWYLTLMDVEGDVITASRKLVGNWPLFRTTTDARKPPGELWVLDTTDGGEQPGLTDLGARVKLLYRDAAEVAA